MLVDRHLSAIDPLPDHGGCPFVFLGPAIDGSQLLLQRSNLLRLLLHLRVALLGNLFEEILHLVLLLHVCLAALALRAWLQAVDAAALGRCNKSDMRVLRSIVNVDVSHELTRNIHAFPEGFSDGRVELDHKILLLCHVIVAMLDQLGDPAAELVTHDRVNDVDEPLPRKARYVALVRHILAHSPVLRALLEDLVDGETLVHGDVEEPHLVLFDDYTDVIHAEMIFLKKVT